jgi:hypothetical protein
MDPAHLLDGLWVPVAQKGHALYDVKGDFDGLQIGFLGVQLDAVHQSVLLAIAARTAQAKKANGVLIKGTSNDLMARQMELLEITGLARNQDVSLVHCRAYALLSDAGMTTNKDGYKQLMQVLKEMSTIVMWRGQWDPETKREKGNTSNLLGFELDGQDLAITLNWRMTDAIFGPQSVFINLHERRALEDPVVKILHCWLSGFIRLPRERGRSSQLMAGKGAEIDTLIRHVWGKRPCTDSVMGNRRMRIREALDLINTLPDWGVRIEGKHAFVSRIRGAVNDGTLLPGDLAEAEEMYQHRLALGKAD